MTKGKFAYMAPEQMSGAHVDHRTDIFALGIVLHEMLTYRSLFARDDINDTLQAIMTADVPPPSSLVNGLPEGLDTIALRALAKEPAMRYQSAKEMQRDLEHLLRRHPATASDLESLMTALFGDGRQRLARIRAGEEEEDEGAEDQPQTMPAIPSKTPKAKAVDLPNFDDDDSTVAGYQRLSDEDETS